MRTNLTMAAWAGLWIGMIMTAAAGRADVVATFTQEWNGNGVGHAPGEPFTRARLGLVSPRDQADHGSSALFSDLILTPADIGRSFSRDAASDPSAFAGLAMALTNGVPDYIGTGYSLFPSGHLNIVRGPEWWVFGLPAGQVDFAGSTITSVDMRVDDLRLYEDVLDGSEVTRIDYMVTFTFHGSVPSPATHALLGLALVARLRRRRS